MPFRRSLVVYGALRECEAMVRAGIDLHLRVGTLVLSSARNTSIISIGAY